MNGLTMQILPANNNNPNFKELCVLKKVLAEIGHTKESLLENSKLRKLSQIYDVRVERFYPADWSFHIIEKRLFGEKKRSYYSYPNELTNMSKIASTKKWALEELGQRTLKKVLARVDEDGNNALHGLSDISTDLLDKLTFYK